MVSRPAPTLGMTGKRVATRHERGRAECATGAGRQGSGSTVSIPPDEPCGRGPGVSSTARPGWVYPGSVATQGRLPHLDRTMDAAATRSEITILLKLWGQGDESAQERLFPLIYDDLRRIARRHRRSLDADQTIETTGLVHEAYLRLVDWDQCEWRDRVQFFAVASRAVRSVVIDEVRRRLAVKRGGDRIQVPLDDQNLGSAGPLEEILAVHEALDKLAEEEPRMARVVECRFFGGMEIAETAEALAISPRTAERDWQRGKLYLYEILRPDRF